jgi:hypothetical protein
MSLIPLYLCVRAMYLVDAFAPEMSAPVAMVHPQACSGGRRCPPCKGLIEVRVCRTGANSAR